MQYSLKTLIIAAGVLPMLAALVAKLGGLGLLFGLVIILVLIIIYFFTKLPLPHATANCILLGAIFLHITLVNYFFPVAAKWADAVMTVAEARGHKFYVDSQEDGLQGIVILLGYLPAICFMFVRILLFHIWESSGFSRLVLSLWLLLVPFLAAWLTIHHYQSYLNVAIHFRATAVSPGSAMIKFVVNNRSSTSG